MKDIFKKVTDNMGPIGEHAKESHGYFTFPKLEGDIGPHMIFRGKKLLNWSLNNYLGLANHPEVRKTDAEAAAQYGLAAPMGARMMSGNSDLHERLEKELSAFVKKEDTILCNFGYQAMVSAIDSLVDRHDVIVYDAESHACILDGMRLHMGKRFVFKHNDIADCEKQLQRATKIAETTGGGILLITEGVFGMRGDQGKLKEIVELKKKYMFRMFVDDAHGIGTMGKTGGGTGEEQGCQDGIDIYFGTFAKSFALIGGFISSTKDIITFLRYNMRSQIFAKSLPTPLVVGALKRIELMRNHPEYREKLWELTRLMQSGLQKAGFNIGDTNSPVTPVYLSGSIPEATNMVKDLRENFGVFCSMVTYPVIPKGMIILRLIPTAMHTPEDVNYTIECFSKIVNKLKNGEYMSDKLASVKVDL
ncbi:MAG: aminotransferase class I/II-fold pyridoxal phosphate-dependent enzyme [Sphingobacteriaceae bacterium]|nr:aminotransferase class I/II-fold pyridoxal phosphate-dependent enzyme [Sphingobacteriaceae bacterium]